MFNDEFLKLFLKTTSRYELESLLSDDVSLSYSQRINVLKLWSKCYESCILDHAELFSHSLGISKEHLYDIVGQCRDEFENNMYDVWLSDKNIFDCE